ncbi:unnamed protein product [Cuscuta epithymum]|uniref:DNA-directed DNA polymerase n=1 Tax=Cuscuta epithymum TaxID=186058 RepID=A0AAV0F287_9ASTE|nr:unnamed protein product [Cuscuta epithymum]
MHRHLFEHIRPNARFVYGTTSWNVQFNDCGLSDVFADLFIENDIAFGSYALLRHVGNFTFEVFMFDKLGFSLNLADKPIGVSNPLHTPDDFLVYVESSFKDYAYSQLYCHPSFLFVPNETSKVCCEAFLRSCSDMRNRVRIFYGDDDAYFVVGKRTLRRQIQTTFELKHNATLFFVKHHRGEALLLTISSCGMERVPSKPHVYEIRSAAHTEFAELP